MQEEAARCDLPGDFASLRGRLPPRTIPLGVTHAVRMAETAAVLLLRLESGLEDKTSSTPWRQDISQPEQQQRRRQQRKQQQRYQKEKRQREGERQHKHQPGETRKRRRRQRKQRLSPLPLSSSSSAPSPPRLGVFPFNPHKTQAPAMSTTIQGPSIRLLCKPPSSLQG